MWISDWIYYFIGSNKRERKLILIAWMAALTLFGLLYLVGYSLRKL